MREIGSDVRRWQGRGEALAVATVVATRRSAPRPVGAKLAVSETGELAGSVSAGCVENDVASVAREVLAERRPRLLTYGIADDLALGIGLPCGGELDVFVERWGSPALDGLLEAAERNEAATRVAVVEGEPLGADALLLPTGEPLGGEGLDLAALDGRLEGARSTLLEVGRQTLFVDVLAPPPRLVVFGAVDLAEQLCRLARVLGWRTFVADPRAGLATRDRVPSADELLVAWPEEALEALGPDASTAVVVLTHDDKLDVPALTGAVATDAFYVGALGSRRSQERRREQLLDAGVDERDLERLSGPVGLDVGAESPAETAVSIFGEILACRSGRDGGRLKVGSGRIHAGTA